MKKYFSQIVVFYLIMIVTASGQNQMPVRQYDLGDWLTIKNCNYVTSVSESHNYIFFGTLGGVIPYHKFNDYEEPAYTTSDGLADDKISVVFFDNATSYLWAAHRLGISFLSPVADRWETPYLFQQGAQWVENIGSTGSVIIAVTSSGYVYLDNQTGRVINGDNFTPENASWSAVATNGSISLDGIYTINPEFILQPDGIVKDREFRKYELNLMYVNNLNDIYGGIFGLGYVTGDNNLKILDLHPSGILKNFVNAFAMSEDHMWIAGVDDSRESEIDRTGISEFNFANQTWNYYEDYSIHELASGKIYEMSFSDDKLAVATMEGVTIYSTKENKWKHYTTFDGLWDNDIKSILIDQNTVLAGSDYGLNEIDLKTGEIKRIYVTGAETMTKIHKIENSEKFYWIGTNDGIFSIDKKDGKIKHFDFYGRELANDKRVAADCYAISANENMVVFKGNNFFIKYDMLANKWENLPDYDQESGVLDMDLFGQYLWIGTDKGARFMNITTEEWEKYGYIDGLAGERVYKVFIDGDWVWFGTDKGLTKYNWRKYVLE